MGLSGGAAWPEKQLDESAFTALQRLILSDYNASRVSTKLLLYQALDFCSLNFRCISPRSVPAGRSRMLSQAATPASRSRISS